MSYKKTTIIKLLIILNIAFGLDLYAQEYLIGPDDVLKIEVYRERELDRKIRVSSDGCISLPLIGKVKAEGKSVAGLQSLLEQMFGRYLKKPYVTIFIEEYSTITVSGQVKKPGSYPITRNLTVLEAISIAGGFTDIASRNDVRVLRRNKEKGTVVVRVADIAKGKGSQKDILLEPGDIVVVPESLF